MPAAIRGAETRSFVHIGAGEHEINAVRIRGKLVASDGVGNYLENLRVAEAVAQVLRISDLPRKRDRVGDRGVVRVVIRRVDIEVRRATLIISESVRF